MLFFWFFFSTGKVGNDSKTFLSQRQVIMRLDLTQRKQTHGDLVKPQLWNNLTVEFLHVTSCGLDIRVQGHFLKCASPPPPPPGSVSFPPYPNKSCFSGKSARPLMFLCRARNLHASGLFACQHVCLQGTEHSGCRRTACGTNDLLEITGPKQSAHNRRWLGAPKLSSQTWLARDKMQALQDEQRSFLPSCFDRSVGKECIHAMGSIVMLRV